MEYLKQVRYYVRERRSEAPGHYFAEPLCTISNLWFVLFGIVRLWAVGHVHTGYALLVATGLCSAFHHAHPDKWTLLVDWIPIALSLWHVFVTGTIYEASTVTLLKMASALFFLFDDHVTQYFPVPWTHVLWHILAAWAIDELYWDAHLAGKS